MSVRIAVYGKGGIGKSTVSSNLSYSLSMMGRRVLQIGCDPKHDSTRLLTDQCTTVLNYIQDTPPQQWSLDDIVSLGSGDVGCIEAGGPQPGIGCAGKGILTMFQTLEKLGIEHMGYDTVIYDVLGDVVCGGFAVPMRETQTDAVLVVTSGEPMSIYAANNIFRGSLGFGPKGRIGGIVLNRKGIPGEDGLVYEFSRATGIPIIADIPRSELISESDRKRRTVCELHSDSEEATMFRNLAERVSELEIRHSELLSPHPLTDTQLDRLFSDGHLDETGGWSPPIPMVTERATRPAPIPRRIGGGAVGAVVTAGRVMDAPVVLHGTEACGYTMLRELTEQQLRNGSPGSILVCSGMRARDVIGGGSDKLRLALETLASEGHRLIFVISACVPCLIGDDCRGVISHLRSSHPDTEIILVETGRTSAGVDAHMSVLGGLVDLIDPNVETDPDTFAIVDDYFDGFCAGHNAEALDSLISRIGMRRIPGFLDNCTLEDVIGFHRTGVACLGSETATCTKLRRMLESKEIRFMENRIPRGFSETVSWIRELGSIVCRKDRADILSEDIRREYESGIDRMGPLLDGTRIAVVSSDGNDVGWVMETLSDLGLESRVFDIGGAPGEYTDRNRVLSDIRIWGPDIVIGNKNATDGLEIVRTDFPDTYVTHKASLMLAERLWNMRRANRTLGWRSWGCPVEHRSRRIHRKHHGCGGHP